MSRCLRDRALLLLYKGEGTSSQQSHLAACEACAERYQRLGSDLEVIGQVLREEPPPQAVRHRPRALTVRWLPTTAALVMSLALVWGGVRMWTTSSPSVEGNRNEEIWRFLEEVSADLFLLDDAIAEEGSPQMADFPYLSASLEEEWFCEGQDPFVASAGDTLSYNPLAVDPWARSELGWFDVRVDDFGGYSFPLLCEGPEV